MAMGVFARNVFEKDILEAAKEV